MGDCPSLTFSLLAKVFAKGKMFWYIVQFSPHPTQFFSEFTRFQFFFTNLMNRPKNVVFSTFYEKVSRKTKLSFDNLNQPKVLFVEPMFRLRECYIFCQVFSEKLILALLFPLRNDTTFDNFKISLRTILMLFYNLYTFGTNDMCLGTIKHNISLC